jgi:hypothetical protein
MGLKFIFPLIGLCLLVAQAELFYGLSNEEQPSEELLAGLQEQAPIIDVDEAQVPEQVPEQTQEQDVSLFRWFLVTATKNDYWSLVLACGSHSKNTKGINFGFVKGDCCV